MPAVSKAQQRFMGMCAHSPLHAHGKCPSQKVSEEFSHAPKDLPERKNPKSGRKVK